MKIGPRGIALIKSYEDLRLRAYLPTPYDVWTIGYGHTLDVERGDVITTEQAEQFFVQDMETYERVVNSRISAPLTQSMFDALVSICYNAGPRTLNPTGTIARCLKAGDYHGAANGFLLWNKQTQNGKLVVLRGLTSRRRKERELFLADGLPGRP